MSDNRWVYWFFDDEQTEGATFQLRAQRTVIGDAPPPPHARVARVQSATPLEAPRARLRGVAQHHQYTDAAQKRDLESVSHAELAPGPSTVAVLIPMRKNDAWWALSQDQRNAHFAGQGHTAIGRRYADRIYRKLYHSRYLEHGSGCDFLTYFEFDEGHTSDFRALLDELRATAEWAYVDLEYEIWMTKAHE